MKSSEPIAAAPPAERVAAFDAATAPVPEVIGDVPAPAAGPGIATETPAELAELAHDPDFQAAAEEYLPKFFNIMAAFAGDHWKLTDREVKIAVPPCAGAMEEVWPFIPELLKNTKFPKVYLFALVMSFPVIARIAEGRKLAAKARAEAIGRGPAAVPGEHRAPQAAAPASTARATVMPASAASSGSSANPDAEKPSGWGGSFTFARG